MALLLDKQPRRATVVTGRFSDGRDRVETIVTIYDVRARDDDGREHTVTFDHDPTDQEVLDALPKPPQLQAGKRAHFRAELLDAYEEWQRWVNTQAELARRGRTVRAQQAQLEVERAWNNYEARLNRWAQAS